MFTITVIETLATSSSIVFTEHVDLHGVALTVLSDIRQGL